MNGPLALALLLLAAPATPAPEPVFVDLAAAWGLDFRYTNGRTGELYFPEIMGGGAALFDYDGDGDLDAFFVQGHPLGPPPRKPHPDPLPSPPRPPGEGAPSLSRSSSLPPLPGDGGAMGEEGWGGEVLGGRLFRNDLIAGGSASLSPASWT